MDDLFWHLEHDAAPTREQRGPSADDYAAFAAWQAARLDRDMQIAWEIRKLTIREFSHKERVKWQKKRVARRRRWLIAGWIAMAASAAVFACLIFCLR